MAEKAAAAAVEVVDRGGGGGAFKKERFFSRRESGGEGQEKGAFSSLSLALFRRTKTDRVRRQVRPLNHRRLRRSYFVPFSRMNVSGGGGVGGR